MASTTFSITIAVLALSSSTYGPPLVRNFMADRGNQFVLGTFVATFLYSLLVLRSIRVVGDGGGAYFIPHLAYCRRAVSRCCRSACSSTSSTTSATRSRSRRSPDRCTLDLCAVIERTFPEDGENVEVAPPTDLPESLEARGAVVLASSTGYVQGVDVDALAAVARQHDVLISLCVRPGQHVTHGARVAVVWPRVPLPDKLQNATRGAVRLGRSRDPHQDVEFPAQLLEEMAVRALSPSTNDPYTAINALDDLASGLIELAGRTAPSPYRLDEDGRLRV